MQPEPTHPDKLSVFFDGSCPLCRKEIGFYQRKRGADGVNWIDVSKTQSGEVAPGLSCQAAMARFHVKTQGGELISGGQAFIALWRSMPGFAWIGVLLDRPMLREIVDFAYDRFLGIRPYLQRLVTKKA